MKELSLNILDIIENSVAARSAKIELSVTENSKNDSLEIEVIDDGAGMTEEFAQKALDPFTTGSSKKRVGLGLPFLKEEAEACEGGLKIKSAPGKGTEVKAVFKNSHIDRPPMGDIAGTVSTVMALHPKLHLVFRYSIDGGCFTVDSKELENMFAPVPLNEPAVIKGVENYIKTNIEELGGR